MRFRRRTLRCNFPLFFVALGAQLFTSALAAGQKADADQQNVPSNIELAVPPPPVNFQNPVAANDLAFLSAYAGKSTDELTKDKQFKNLLKKAIPNTNYHYGTDMPLVVAVDDAVAKSSTPVEIVDGRYLFAAGSKGPYLGGAGFYWVDLQSGIFLGGFYFHPTNGEPTPTLTVFSRQLQDNFLSMTQFPPEFAAAVTKWSTANHVPPVTARYFVPTNGRKYVLIHDEDYCSFREGIVTPPPDVCSQMNSIAAEVDMNAAYFMKETNNAANATAWMLHSDQVEWLAVRDRSCIGPNALGCRVTMTRERTHVILGHPVPPPRPQPIGPRR